MCRIVNEAAQRRDAWNACRYEVGGAEGHYESYFQRANHPTRPLAFWIRYTLFSPKGRPENAVGELWAIYFDGEGTRTTAVKQAVPLSRCRFSQTGLDVQIGEAILKDGVLGGTASSGGHRLDWSLRYEGNEPPLLLLPRSFYERRFPKAKALVGTPNAAYFGQIRVDGQEVAVDGWIGSQNHNWGRRHTDHYAWAQVAGFDNAPQAFLECSTARIKIGPFRTPWLTPVVLRVAGREFALNTLRQSLRARGHFDYFTWTFESRTREVCLIGRVHAPASMFVGLRYANPPGGSKTCLNTKLAGCELRLDREGEPSMTLVSKHRAAFEILTDDHKHGIPISA